MDDDELQSLLGLAPLPDDPDEALAASPVAEPSPATPPPVAYVAPEPPAMPSPLDMLDDGDSTAKNVNKLLEADALLNATALNMLSQKLINLAYQSDDVEEVRKAVLAVRDGAMLHEKRKTTVASQAPLTIVFQRAESIEKVDVRRGAELAQLRRQAEKAVDA